MRVYFRDPHDPGALRRTAESGNDDDGAQGHRQSCGQAGYDDVKRVGAGFHFSPPLWLGGEGFSVAGPTVSRLRLESVDRPSFGPAQKKESFRKIMRNTECPAFAGADRDETYAICSSMRSGIDP
jgi:hypothetical protein